MSISLAIVFPVVLLLLLLVVQAALWWYDRQVALSAAREGVDAGRVQGNATDEVKNQAAQRQARDFLDRQGAHDYTVRTDGSTADTIRVTVQLRPPLLIPGLSAPVITQFAEAPRERFVPPAVKP
ncbi:TadE/TadG family type IV pilus assembly protein [Kitasatospora xanthocidica]|uniref:TadE/TadG family type IV pilus assembly protein n=1 Tax=Kitasatospora xanthocidica TaxID=83382 RepID=UPI00199F969A|nr:TadE/TadG family type IV pilus assembly protein [Kitasatospora xanthocidica]GHF32879.1 membrane protein [Kitasatospora xanthocidica]